MIGLDTCNYPSETLYQPFRKLPGQQKGQKRNSAVGEHVAIFGVHAA